MSNTERSRAHRARKADALAAELAAVPVADSGPGEVETAIDAMLAGLRGADPVLSVLARRLARHMDASVAVNHQVAAELRRTVNDLRGRSARNAAKQGLSGGKTRPNKVSVLRADYQASRSKRVAG